MDLPADLATLSDAAPDDADKPPLSERAAAARRAQINSRMPRWSETDLKALRRAALNRIGVEAASKLIGRSPAAVRCKAVDLGLSLARPRS